MGFSINTNIASLQAQYYLTQSSQFQSKTIESVTSGLRIVHSGDDAAGLAIANGYRSDAAVLTQGIQNANDGLSQLQIADGGLNNISQLLDRARTLATQSASGTFTGDRSVLNNEFTSVLGEIDREAQSVGLNQGGTFAKNLSVFIGGGQGTTSQGVINNGSVSLNLSQATVDTQSLGLKGFTAGYQVAAGTNDAGLYDLGSSSSTSVSSIITANAPANNATSFVITGPGFSGGAGGPITVNVNLQNVSDTTSLVNAINAGISSAEQTGTSQATAFQAANIAASVHTGTDGHQQLVFTSAGSAFSVTAGDATANAFLGNLTGQTHLGDSTASSAVGQAATTIESSFVAGGTQQYTADYGTALAGGDAQVITLTANNADGVQQSLKVSLSGANTAAQAVTTINQALQQSDNPALQTIVASTDPTGATITFSNSGTSPFSLGIGATTGVATDGLTDNTANHNEGVIVSSAQVGVGSSVDITSQAAAEQAVTAIGNATQALGNAQAIVGRGENQFTYAVNLASSQLTNEQAAESGIRDANLATEAANLTKAQTLIQAGVAALAQANSAPQSILSLLKG